MRDKELAATLVNLRRVLADPRLEPAHRERLRKGERELEKIRRSGKLDRKEVFRATLLISSTLVEMLSEPNAPTDDSTTAARRAR